MFKNLFLHIKSSRRPVLGAIIVHNKKPYSYLGRGIYIRRFFSLTFKIVYEITFINNKKENLKITVLDKKHLGKYKNLPEVKINKRIIRKG